MLFRSAVGRARSKNPAMGGNDERENTLNALLTEMDGFGTNSGIITLAATNRADMLDSALLRAGRFDRQIHVDLPDLNERKEVFMVHLKPLKLDSNVDVDFLARQTPGFSGADIANVCNEAALIAARFNRECVGKQDFLDAVDRIIGGLEKKTKVMTQAEKRSIAIHEAGHATISWFTQYANPLVKVSIVPRGQRMPVSTSRSKSRNRRFPRTAATPPTKSFRWKSYTISIACGSAILRRKPSSTGILLTVSRMAPCPAI